MIDIFRYFHSCFSELFNRVFPTIPIVLFRLIRRSCFDAFSARQDSSHDDLGVNVILRPIGARRLFGGSLHHTRRRIGCGMPTGSLGGSPACGGLSSRCHTAKEKPPFGGSTSSCLLCSIRLDDRRRRVRLGDVEQPRREQVVFMGLIDNAVPTALDREHFVLLAVDEL